jgi:hypothetical protein
MPNERCKYFWDGERNISETFMIQRIVEYAAFPDIVKLPFEPLKQYLLKTQLSKLRTSEKRKQFFTVLLPYLETSHSLEEDVFQLIKRYFVQPAPTQPGQAQQGS